MADETNRTISGLRNDIDMLDIAPSSSPNTNRDLQWICCICTFHNHSLLKQCEICAAEIAKECQWKEKSICKKRIRPYDNTRSISASKRRKKSNTNTNTNTIAREYKERELRLIQIHQIEKKKLQRQLQEAKIENARLLKQNQRYQVMQQGIKWMLDDHERTESIHDSEDELQLNNSESNIKLETTDNRHVNHNNMRNDDVGLEREKLWQCQYCPKRFSTKGYRKYHEGTHNSAIQYECNLCNTQFIRKTYYYQHLGTKKHQKKLEEQEEEEGMMSCSVGAYTKEQRNIANDEVDF
eukprot:934406_1